MPLTEADFREPKFSRQEERYPMSRNKDDRYNEICPRHDVARYRGNEGREGGWKQAGYNPNHNSTSVEKMSIRTESVQLKSY